MTRSIGGEFACRTIEITASDFADTRSYTISTDATMTRVGKLLNPNRVGEPEHLKEGFALHCSRPLASE